MNKFDSIKAKVGLIDVGVTILSLIISYFIIDGLSLIGNKYNIEIFKPRSMAHYKVYYLFPIISCILFVLIRKIIDNIFFGDISASKETILSGKAALSFIFSCLFGWLIPPISIIGIILGHLALRKIRISPNLRGKSLAIMGLVFGYFWFLRELYLEILIRN